jgi:hypothetical protein
LLKGRHLAGPANMVTAVDGKIVEHSAHSRVFLFIGGGFLILALAALLVGGELRRRSLESVPAAGIDEPTQTAVPETFPLEIQINQPALVPTQALADEEALILQDRRGISNLYIEFIFDAANSILNGHVDAVLNRDVAGSLLSENLRNYSAEMNIGLRMVKNRPGEPANEQAACRDAELIAPLRAGQIEFIAGRLVDFEAQGPLALQPALMEALMDFDHGDPQRVNYVVIISSGQDSCWGDPCRLVEFMSDRGLNLTFDVVGLGAEGTARKQLSCIAEKGGGIYYDVQDSAGYEAALDQILARTVAAERITTLAAATAAAQALIDDGVATRINRLAEAVAAFTTPASTAVTPQWTATSTITPDWTATPTITATALTATPKVTVTGEPPEITSTPTPQQVIALPTAGSGGSLGAVPTQKPGCSGISCVGDPGSGSTPSAGGGGGPGADPGFPGG